MTNDEFRVKVYELGNLVLVGKIGTESTKARNLARELMVELRGGVLFTCLEDGCDEPGLLLCDRHLDRAVGNG